MGHTITITLSEAAQRAAILAGQPAANKQTYDVPAELLPRLLALPWAYVGADGTVTCVVADVHDWSSGYRVTLADADVSARPIDPGEAVSHAESVVAATGRMRMELKAEAKRQAATATAERDAARVAREAYASLPLTDRVRQRSHDPLTWDAVSPGGDFRHWSEALRDAQVEAQREAERRTVDAHAARLASGLIEVRAWIAEHGSERLRLIAAEGDELLDASLAVYRDERLAAERPGWAWERTLHGKVEEIRNPSLVALHALADARSSGVTDAALMSRTWISHEVCCIDDDCSCCCEAPEDERTERCPTLVAEFLGCEIARDVASDS